jgi:hypothetical protein
MLAIPVCPLSTFPATTSPPILFVLLPFLTSVIQLYDDTWGFTASTNRSVMHVGAFVSLQGSGFLLHWRVSHEVYNFCPLNPVIGSCWSPKGIARCGAARTCKFFCLVSTRTSDVLYVGYVDYVMKNLAIYFPDMNGDSRTVQGGPYHTVQRYFWQRLRVQTQIDASLRSYASFP